MFTGFVIAQNKDSLRKVDSLQLLETNRDSAASLIEKKPSRLTGSLMLKLDSSRIDSVSARSLEDSGWVAAAGEYSNNNFIIFGFKKNKFFGFSTLPVIVTSNKKEFEGKEVFFYVLLALLLFFAFIRLSFPKYVIDLFRVAFRTTLKQRQIGEQLVQTPLPSLLFNFFFLISSSLYLSFVLQHYHLAFDYNFWLLFLYCLVGLIFIYTIKLLSLRFSGWLFNISATTDGYIFIVFMINKIIGIYLLPFLIFLAFTDDDIYLVAFILSYIGVLALLAYRFILSYGLARSQIRVNPFHFFLYLCV